jgi:hypothetical protein
MPTSGEPEPAPDRHCYFRLSDPYSVSSRLEQDRAGRRADVGRQSSPAHKGKRPGGKFYDCWPSYLGKPDGSLGCERYPAEAW